MSLAGLMSAVVRIVGLLMAAFAFQLTTLEQFQRGLYRPNDPSYQTWVVPITLCAWLAVAILIVQSKPIGTFLAQEIEDRETTVPRSILLTSRELTRLGYKLTGLVLCGLALIDVLATIAWWSQHRIEDGEASTPSILHLVSPILTLGFGLALMLAARRAPMDSERS